MPQAAITAAISFFALSGEAHCSYLVEHTADRKKYLYYNFYNFKYRQRVEFITKATAPQSSISLISPSAQWSEREVSEMYGVVYLNKDDSRNLLLDYSSSFNPLLSEFPCSGYLELQYSPTSEAILWQVNQPLV